MMPTPFEGLGMDNPWFGLGLSTATTVELPSGRSIRVVSAPLYLVTKIAAFDGRGAGDHLWSKDFEDIVALLDGRARLSEECGGAPIVVRRAVRAWAADLLEWPNVRDLVQGHVSRGSGREGWKTVLARLQALADLQ